MKKIVSSLVLVIMCLSIVTIAFAHDLTPIYPQYDYPVLSDGSNDLVRGYMYDSYVHYLQRTLTISGYDCGKIDGYFGLKTQTAVIRFQQDHNLTDDGIVGHYTWGKIIAHARYYGIDLPKVYR